MLTIVYEPSADRDLERLDGPVRQRIVLRLEAYVLGAPSDVKKLTGSDQVRLRVGDFRVIFERTHTTLIVHRVLHRKEAYR